ncbi:MULTISPECIES: ABATE domain-containing protein [unclassified Parafrankia]|uniref:CGNR zinc finger domain-containing protein n=1 Tax=unclassified Parafrankia TaxID=2994368 RepID=UPI000DA5A983|nr:MULTISPECIES: CGNR zinc finger domain-containing protein [unclassified Parafrankia]CAI7976997.1 zf-CGNR domain-containing protein [Frankia sp. Hr75.2]SQD98547.1 conserved hypothetical protein [Parafrankia sp. Ea1.12]
METTATNTDGMVVDGLPAWEMNFHFLSGRLCLSFTATVGERWRRNFERLPQPADLGRWFVAAGLLDVPPAVTEEGLRSARRLREAIYRTALAGTRDEPGVDGDRRVINAHARRGGLAPQLTARRSVELRPGRSPAADALATVARDAVDLLGGPDITRVRECASHDCALLFLDTSRPGRRRWCSDRACGNRARAAAHRARHS